MYPRRAFEPNFQRFLNQDPIGERGGINLYGFVGNNPVGNIDPLGLQANIIEPDMVLRPTPPYYPRGTMPPEELDKELDDLKKDPLPMDTQIGPMPEEVKPETPPGQKTQCPQNSGGGITGQNAPPFFHYTSNPNLAGGGLRPGSGVTTAGNLNAQQAMFNLGIDPPQYVYPVTLARPQDYLAPDTGIPARNGISAYTVTQPTPSGSVGSPSQVPPGK
jgi:hypothetical protein